MERKKPYRSAEQIIEGLKKRDWIALSKAITIIDNGLEGKKEILDYACKNAGETALVLGITGSGGVGKSTLINCLLEHYSRMGKAIGVIAVDPSSSFTGGAVLGDRIRMANKLMSSELYVRSFASRGNLGGISQGAKDVLYVYKAFGFDIIIVESYGVGQAEMDINNFVDVSAVVMVPGNGDHIQLAKAGVQEIADVFVINKADNVEAEMLYAALIATFETIQPENRPYVLKTIAKENKGTKELADLLLTKAVKKENFENKKRIRIINEISTNAYSMIEAELYSAAGRLTDKVLNEELTPYEAAQILGRRIKVLD